METTPENQKTAWLLLALYGFNLAGMLVWPDQWLISSGQRFKFASLLQPLYYAIFLIALPVAALAKLTLKAPHKVIAFLPCAPIYRKHPGILELVQNHDELRADQTPRIVVRPSSELHKPVGWGLPHQPAPP